MKTGNDIKKNCAQAALQYIPNHSVIGLGGGSTITYLIDFIKEKNLQIKIVTPSAQTRMLCLQKGLEVLHTSSVEQVAVAFDGCDQVDHHLRALKSGGGIHTKEKLIGHMADDYILLVDKSKVVDTLTFQHPVVLEVLEDSLAYVTKAVRALGGKTTIRTSNAKDGFIISDNGHLLIDVQFENVTDIEKLENNLKNISGVIDTSLFINVVTKVLIASDEGITILSK
ncbi:ribose 5-phosphate isomerase A [Heyndrickxia ginsengihumi]|uniref:Ribose 5-phosphate isomerase A n=1 Tax=Heyndrickxia ginsengihumi TaxID=363870 RepID=A0A6M0P2U7_9BACI|nr:ribose 5-phosphate isomerase A [Heyndrickxia ginsengihumi]MCM3022281.1 ribose 5-phosphate isomerase A [Heyndrickxia ginsengihumi]NEY18515.1 ribose 5-phosphate isomerase A [Heyndrickxia ginsengihumi]